MARTWQHMTHEEILDSLVDMEEERYLRTVAAYLKLAGVETVITKAPSLSYTGWVLEFPDGNGKMYDFYVSSGGLENGFSMQIVGDLLGKIETFIDLPFDRPVTSAYIILDYRNNTARKEY